MPAHLENSAVATGIENVSFHSSSKERHCQECSNYHTTVLVSHANKVMLKILQRGFNSMRTKNFQMFKLDLEKAEEPEIKLLTSAVPGASMGDPTHDKVMRKRPDRQR